MEMFLQLEISTLDQLLRIFNMKKEAPLSQIPLMGNPFTDGMSMENQNMKF